MAKLSKDDLLARYKQRVEVSRRWRDTEDYDDTWKRMRDLYALKHYPKSMTSEDRIAVAICKSTVDVIAPSVAINNPKITIMGKTPDDDDSAIIAEAAVNYWWRHYRYQPEYQRAVKDFLIYGHGWIKVGYRYKEKTLNLGEDEIAEQVEQAKAEANAYAEQNPDFAAELPTDEDIAGQVPTTTTKVVEDRPFVERVSPFDVFVDPEATSMSEVKWIAQRITRQLDDVRKDPRYKPSARKRVGADATINTDYLKPDADTRQYGDDIKRVTIWEFYDVTKSTMCVFAESCDEYLVDPEEMPYAFGHPFEMLRNYEVPDRFYPIGEIEALEPLQHELNRVRSDMANNRKRYKRKYMYRPSAFGPEGRAALTSEVDGTMVPVADETTPLQDLVQPLPRTPLDPQMYQYSDQIEADMNAVSGLSEYARGALPEIRRTATEASIIQDAANARAADKLSIVEAGIRSVAEKLVALAQQFMTGEQMAYIVGPSGAQVWAPYDSFMISGQFDFDVEAGSTQPMNETFRRQQATQLLTTLAPFMETGLVNAQALLSYVLQFGFGLKNVEQFLNPMPPMMPGMPMPGEEAPPPQGGALMPPPPGGAAPQGMDPAVMQAILAQLEGQVGLNLSPQGAI